MTIYKFGIWKSRATSLRQERLCTLSTCHKESYAAIRLIEIWLTQYNSIHQQKMCGEFHYFHYFSSFTLITIDLCTTACLREANSILLCIKYNAIKYANAKTGNLKEFIIIVIMLKWLRGYYRNKGANDRVPPVFSSVYCIFLIQYFVLQFITSFSQFYLTKFSAFLGWYLFLRSMTFFNEVLCHPDGNETLVRPILSLLFLIINFCIQCVIHYRIGLIDLFFK